MFYTGIDLHKVTSFLTTLDSSGKIIKQENIENIFWSGCQTCAPKVLLNYLDNFKFPFLSNSFLLIN